MWPFKWKLTALSCRASHYVAKLDCRVWRTQAIFTLQPLLKHKTAYSRHISINVEMSRNWFRSFLKPCKFDDRENNLSEASCICFGTTFLPKTHPFLRHDQQTSDQSNKRNFWRQGSKMPVVSINYEYWRYTIIHHTPYSTCVYYLIKIQAATHFSLSFSSSCCSSLLFSSAWTFSWSAH